MSNWRAVVRHMEAARKQAEREAKKRQRELERQWKEEAKLSEIERACLEVEQFENCIEVLLSVHKEQSSPVDWVDFVAALPPHLPLKVADHEFGALLDAKVAWSTEAKAAVPHLKMSAMAKDQMATAGRDIEFEQERKEWRALHSLAEGVLAGNTDAYETAFERFSAFDEVSALGTSFELKFHTAKIAECRLQVPGHEIIPAETKSLTASKKLSLKPMPKNRFQEIYQDHVCGCILRVGREMLALLPLDTVLVTAFIKESRRRDIPVLSVALTRQGMAKLDFQRLDPSDTVERFVHRGDAKASRKSGTFTSITPLTLSDIAPVVSTRADLQTLLAEVSRLRVEFATSRRTPAAAEAVPTPNQASLETIS